MKLLINEDPSIVLAKPDKSSKSYAWISDCFLMIFHNNVKQNYVFCKMCSSLITYNSVHGTGSLLRHICYRRTLSNRGDQSGILDDSITARKDKGDLIQHLAGPSSSAIKGTDLSKHKKEFEEMIANGDPTIELHAPANIKSEIWSNGNFKMVYQNGKKMDYVMCLLCKSLITYRSKTGTASLLRHSCMKHVQTRKRTTTVMKLEVQSKNDDEVEVQEIVEGKFVEVDEMPITVSGTIVEQDQSDATEFPEEFKEEASKLFHYLSYKDMQSPNLSHRKGFLNFGQYLINIGAEYGKVSINSVLENRDYVHFAENFTNILENMLKSKFEEHKIALSCDIWADPNRKTNYLSVYGHYIDEVFQLKKVNLGTEAFPLDNADFEYRQLMESILENYFPTALDLQVFLAKTTVVMSSDLEAHFKQYSTINCSCWSLNLIVQNLINIHNLKDLIPGELLLAENWANLLEYLERMDKKGNPNIGKLLMVLNPFKLASKSLSSDQKPTINEVYIFRKKLEDHFAKLSDKSVAEMAHTLINENLPVTNLHKIAIFLDPRFKSLKFMSPEDKANTINMTSKMISTDELTTQIIHQEQDLHKGSSSQSESGSKSGEGIDCSDSAKYLIEYMDISEERDETHDEIETYLNLKFNDTYSAKILEFWDSRYDLPRLRQLAKEILCIPACGLATEKIFSDDAMIFVKRRLSMEIESIKDMLFIHENFELLSNAM